MCQWIKNYVAIITFLSSILAADELLATEKVNTASSPSPRSVEFKIERTGGLPLVSLRALNRRLTFLVNTTSSVTALDLGCREAFGWELSQRNSTTQRTGRQGFEQLEPLTLHAGPMTLQTEPVLVLDLSELRRSAKTQIDGMLGMDVLRSLIVRFDFDAGILAFHEALPKNPGQRIPMSAHASGVPMVDFRIGDEVVSLFISTTSLGCVSLEQRTFDHFHQVSAIRHCSSVQGGGDKVGFIQRTALGDWRHSEVMVNVEPLNGLGIGYLSRYCVTFDFPNQMAFLKKGGQFERVDQLGTCGLSLQKVTDGFRIDRVRPGSPAWDAEIADDDQLLQVNGRDCRSLSMSELYRLLERETSGLDLHIQRGTELIDVKIALRRDGRIWSDNEPAQTRRMPLSEAALEQPTEFSKSGVVEGSLVVLPVTIGSSAPMHFMLDTGAGMSVISSRRTSHLESELSVRSVGTPYGRRTMRRFRRAALAIDGFPIAPSGCMLACDLSWLGKEAGIRCDGILGLDAIRSHIVQIDWKKGFVQFSSQVPENAGAELPLLISETGVPMVECTLGTLPPEWFVIDTGWSGDITATHDDIERLAERHEFIPVGKVSNSEFPEWEGDGGTADSIAVGAFRDSDIGVTSAEHRVLGNEYLSRYVLTLDIPGRKVHLKRALARSR